jgi:hypothetical protein
MKPLFANHISIKPEEKKIGNLLREKRSVVSTHFIVKINRSYHFLHFSDTIYCEDKQKLSISAFFG